MKKTYYQSKAEVNYRKIVAQRKARREKPKLEQEFFNRYGKWPTSIELIQTKPYLIKHPDSE